MNLQNNYQLFLSNNLNEEFETYMNYINIDIIEFKDLTEFVELTDMSFSLLESPIVSNKKQNKFKILNSIKKFISTLIQKQEIRNIEIKKNNTFKYINKYKFTKPSYKKYSYMDYVFYKDKI